MAAQTLTWNMTQLIVKFREDTGRSQTTDISDNDVAKLINDYYVNYFAGDTGVDEFNTFFTQALSATDDGKYTLNQNIDRLDDPVTINGNQITFYRDRELFFSGNNLHGHHHRFTGLLTTLHSSHFHKFEDEQFITDPTLVIGTDTTKVKHSDFDYSINDFAYSKSSSEVTLTGSTVPQNKYGAWSLKIDTDGTITVAAADDNVTGYDTPRLALEALGSSDSSSVYMGYVTVIETAAAGFIPDTTSLATGGTVTATFTDGRFENRSTPVTALLYGTQLFVHPKPNDIYQFKALSISDRPTALDTNDEVADPKHGSLIARMTALKYLSPRGGQDRILELAPETQGMLNSVRLDKIKRLTGQVVQRSF